MSPDTRSWKRSILESVLLVRAELPCLTQGWPTSSTAEADYANGCIWVQGPDNVERIGFIDLKEADNAQYRSAFDMSVPERKILDEGSTHTFTAHHWGYYTTSLKNSTSSSLGLMSKV